MQHPKLEVTVSDARNSRAISAALVRRAVLAVLDLYEIESAEYSVVFLSGQQMRALNRRSFGRDRATDVIAFGLPHPGLLVGDVYVCPSVARRLAREFNVSEREEMVRLVVHGTLHTLGYDHPSGEGRSQSDMWRAQEECVRRILGGN